MCENEHSPFETPLHKIYEKEVCLSPIPSLAMHCTNVNSIFGLSPNIDWIKKTGMKMKIKDILAILLFSIFFKGNANGVNLEKKFPSLKDFLILKFDLYLKGKC